MQRLLTVLSRREESSMVSTWNVALCFCAGDEKRYRIFEGRYTALAEAATFYNEETEKYGLPTEIKGSTVVGLEDDYVVGGEINWCNPEETVQFNDLADRELKEWLALNKWHDPEVWRAIMSAVTDVAKRETIG
jgi:hypothetical protein